MGQPLRLLTGHQTEPFLLCCSDDGKVLASVSSDRKILVWNTRTGKLIQTIDDNDNPNQPVSIIAVSPDGKLLATGCPDYTTKVFHAKTGRRIAQLSDELKSKINSAEQITFSPGGEVIACAHGKSIDLFDTTTWQLSDSLKGHTSKVHLPRFTPDGKTLASAAGKSLILWNRNGIARSTQTHRRTVAAMDITADSSTIVTSDEGGEIVRWNVSDGSEISRYRPHPSYVFSLAVSVDGQFIASGDLDGTLKICEVETATEKFFQEYESVSSILFSPDGSRIAVSSDQGVDIIRTNRWDAAERLPCSPSLVFSPTGAWLAGIDGTDIVLYKMPRSRPTRS